jgi:hypothetical protein
MVFFSIIANLSIVIYLGLRKYFAAKDAILIFLVVIFLAGILFTIYLDLFTFTSCFLYWILNVLLLSIFLQFDKEIKKYFL